MLKDLVKKGSNNAGILSKLNNFVNRLKEMKTHHRTLKMQIWKELTKQEKDKDGNVKDGSIFDYLKFDSSKYRIGQFKIKCSKETKSFIVRLLLIFINELQKELKKHKEEIKKRDVKRYGLFSGNPENGITYKNQCIKEFCQESGCTENPQELIIKDSEKSFKEGANEYWFFLLKKKNFKTKKKSEEYFEKAIWITIEEAQKQNLITKKLTQELQNYVDTQFVK